MFTNVFLLEIYSLLLNLYNNHFGYLVIYFLNIIVIFYIKLDQDSKNFLFNYVTFDFFNETNDLNDKNFKEMFKMNHVSLDNVKVNRLTLNTNKINLFIKKKKAARLFIKQSIFCRVDSLFNILNINKKLFFNINFRYFRFIYNLYLNSYDIELYYSWIHIVLDKYNDLYSIYSNYYNDDIVVFNNNYIFYPNNILVNINFNLSGIKVDKLRDIYSFERYLGEFSEEIDEYAEWGVDRRISLKNKYHYSIFLNFNNNYSNSGFRLNFLRIQRRYNKRRYSKVRAVSRNSFFAGITLSSIMLGILWGGSIKNVDWITSRIVVIDVNLIIFILFIYFIYRLYIVYNPSIFIRKKNKIRIITSIQKLFILNIWFKK